MLLTALVHDLLKKLAITEYGRFSIIYIRIAIYMYGRFAIIIYELWKLEFQFSLSDSAQFDFYQHRSGEHVES